MSTTPSNAAVALASAFSPWTSSLIPTVFAGGVTLVAMAVALALSTHYSRRPRPACHDATPPRRTIHSLNTTIPIIGDLLFFTRNAHRKHDLATELCLRFNGEPWQAHIVGMPTFVNFADPRAIEEITTTQFENFEKGAFQRDVLHDLLGDGIVASDGARWYHQRKTAVKFFSARSLRDRVQHAMARNLDQVYTAIDATHGINTQERVDLSQLFHQFTLQTFAEAGLGVAIPLIGQPEPHAFERALDAALPIVSRRGRLPPFVWKLERWLGVGPEKVLADSMKIVRRWIHDTIERSLEGIRQRQADGTIDHAHGQSIVELFVQHSGDEKDGMQPDDLLDFILNFVIAARDTSALTLSWLFYALGKHPDVVASIRQEMQHKIPHGTPFLTADDVQTLTQLEAAIKETLRLYPGGPNTVKQVVRDTVICDDIYLCKGMMIGINAYALARNPRVWGPDAAEFRPQRWIVDEATGELTYFPASKFFTFHAGPRSCVGMKLAMLNLRVVAANLLHRYEIEIDPANDGSYLNAPTLVMKHPLLATLVPRSD